VRILADNQLAGRTDSNGNALIPRLRAYDRNVISVDQRDVPLDAEIRALKIETVPYFRSGVDVTFPIKRSRGATFTIRLEDGKPLPVGASVRIVGKDETYAVGYDGEVYVVGLDPANRLRATWRGQSCEFELRFTASTDPLPDLGTFICKGVKP
jgi:outer membrane usher protein